MTLLGQIALVPVLMRVIGGGVNHRRVPRVREAGVVTFVGNVIFEGQTLNLMVSCNGNGWDAGNEVLSQPLPSVPTRWVVDEVFTVGESYVVSRCPICVIIVRVGQITDQNEQIRLVSQQLLHHGSRVFSLSNVSSDTKCEGVGSLGLLGHGKVEHLRESVGWVSNLIEILHARHEVGHHHVMDDWGLQ